MVNKTANLVIVGGTVAAGKSTFVRGLAQAMQWKYIPEIHEDNPLQKQILKKLYDGSTRLHRATIQCYFLSHRLEQYQQAAAGAVTTILDRGAWEDALFAKLLMANEKASYVHFETLWKAIITKLLHEYGKPQAYFFLKINWSTFKSRIYQRNREEEIANFEHNAPYFKDLLHEYNSAFEPLLISYGIKPIVIASDDLEQQTTLKIAIEQFASSAKFGKNNQL